MRRESDGSTGAAATGDIDPPEEPNVTPEDIREKGKALWDLVGVITGNSGDMRSAFTKMQVQFSDVVRDDISTGAEYNGSKWQEAARALIFGAEIAYCWADDVENYNKRGQALMANAKVSLFAFRVGAPQTYQSTQGVSPYQEGAGGFTAPFSNMRYVGDGDPDLSTFTPEFISWQTAEIKKIVDEYKNNLKGIRQDLLDDGDERVRDLRRGPEHDATIRKLVDAGYFGWAPYNIQGPGENPPLPVTSAEAKEWSKEIDLYLSGDKRIDEKYYYIVNALAAISSKAENLQYNADGSASEAPSDHHIRREEIEVLETFFDEYEKEVRPVVYLKPSHKLEGDDVEQHNELMRHVGAGLLVLSNPDLGGNEDLLPESIRKVSHGHAVTTAYTDDWSGDMERLNTLLGAAPSNLEGGKEFSANITTSIGHHMNTVDNSQDDWDHEQTFLDLLEISTRNDDANHSILSDSHDHPQYEENGNALKGLFTQNWSDDGTAVAQLMDWIPEAASSEDEDVRGQAAEAVSGLIEMLGGDTERYQALIDTGVDAEDANGEKIPDASFGWVNPMIARSLGGAALGGLEVLSNPVDEESELARTRFLEFVMADETAATDLYTVAGIADMAAVSAVAQGEMEPGVAGARTATFRGLLDTALRLEALERTDDIEEMEKSVQKSQERIGERALGLLQGGAYAATGFAGGPNLLTSASTPIPVAGAFFGTALAFQEFQFLRGDHFAGDPDRVYQDVQVITDASGNRINDEDGSTFNPTSTGQAVRLEVLNALVDDDEIQFDQVKEFAPELITSEDGEERLKTFSEIDTNDLISEGSDGQSVGGKVVRLLRGADAPEINQPVGDGEAANDVISTHEMTNDYLFGYFPTYERVAETEMTIERAEELRGRK